MLGLITAVHIISSLAAPIPDCDEVFNYWEPLHFLLYGTGQQTWEYSPDYALRSFYYLLLHWPAAWFFSVFSRVVAFKLTRTAIGFACGLSQHFCITGLKESVSAEQIRTTYTLYILSTGFYLAAPTFLPSTFAMNCLSIAFGAYLRYQHTMKQTWLLVAVLAGAHAAVVGWPFCLVVIGLFVSTSILLNPRCMRNPNLYVYAIIGLAVTVVPSFFADWYFYGRQTLAVFNVILYNTSFGSNLVGSSVLYGVEPWTFYFKNLLLNFNLALPLALTSPVLLLFKSTQNRSVLACLVVSFFGWLLLMTSQPHKEERFMYVVYPSICILAAWVLHSLKSFLRVSLVLGFCALSVLRSVQMTRSFFAPMLVWDYPLEGRVCVGREWYRFPSSFFLNEAELAFYNDGFTGQLPQAFTSTSAVPSDFNSYNKEEASRYVPLDSCDYVVDVDLPSAPLRSELRTWTVIKSAPFLDAESTPQPFRSLYLPGGPAVFGKYLLLKQ